MNPTQDVLEQRLAALEGGSGARARFGSGRRDLTLVLTITEAGDNIIASSALYGGPTICSRTRLPQFRIASRSPITASPSHSSPLIDEKTKAILSGVTGNPQGNVTDSSGLRRSPIGTACP